MWFCIQFVVGILYNIARFFVVIASGIFSVSAVAKAIWFPPAVMFVAPDEPFCIFHTISNHAVQATAVSLLDLFVSQVRRS